MAEEVKDLYLSNNALRKLITLLVDDVSARLPILQTVMPMTYEEANAADVKDNVPTVLAVFKALEQIDHIKFRLMKGQPGQSFEDYMTGKTPEELALYLYRTADTPNFDLWIYDASQGYARVGKDSVSAEDLDLTNYWSKEELDINGYWSKEELRITDFVSTETLGEYAKLVDLDAYLRKDEIDAMTEEQVEEIFNEVKASLNN